MLLLPALLLLATLLAHHALVLLRAHALHAGHPGMVHTLHTRVIHPLLPGTWWLLCLRLRLPLCGLGLREGRCSAYGEKSDSDAGGKGLK